MNICLFFTAYVSNIICTIPYTMITAGLYENIITSREYLSDENVSNIELANIEISSLSFSLNDMCIFICDLDTIEGTVYGVVKYEMFKSNFYDAGERSHQIIRVVYDHDITENESGNPSKHYNVRFLDLKKEEVNILELNSNMEGYYKDIIGDTIKNEYERLVIKVGKQNILKFELNDKLKFSLLYYKSYEECLADMKDIFEKDIDIIGYDKYDSSEKFLKYYSNKIQQETLSLENYIEAAKMIGDLYNMIGHLRYTNHRTYDPFHEQDTIVENDVVKIYRSVCLKFDHSDLGRNSYFEVTGFDSNDQLISKEFLFKRVKRFILIPFDEIIKYGIESIEITIDGKKTERILVSKIIKNNETPKKAEN